MWHSEKDMATGGYIPEAESEDESPNTGDSIRAYRDAWERLPREERELRMSRAREDLSREQIAAEARRVIEEAARVRAQRELERVMAAIDLEYDVGIMTRGLETMLRGERMQAERQRAYEQIAAVRLRQRVDQRMLMRRQPFTEAIFDAGPSTSNTSAPNPNPN